MAARCRAASRRFRSMVTTIIRSAMPTSSRCRISGTDPPIANFVPRCCRTSHPKPAPVAACAGACDRGDHAPLVSAIIPCLDEETAIGKVVTAVLARDVSEVVVVDGGSRDRTVERATAAGARVIVELRRGYGRAIQAGIAAVRGDADILVFLDGDGSDPAEFIPDSGVADCSRAGRLRARLARAWASRARQPRATATACRPCRRAAPAPGLWRALHRPVTVSCDPP